VAPIDLGAAVAGPRGDSYTLARFTTDHINHINRNDPTPVGSTRHVFDPGDHVQFELCVEPGTHDREAHNVPPA